MRIAIRFTDAGEIIDIYPKADDDVVTDSISPKVREWEKVIETDTYSDVTDEYDHGTILERDASDG